MAEVSRREHIVRDVIGGLVLLGIGALVSYFAGIGSWLGQQIEWFGEPVTVFRDLVLGHPGLQFGVFVEEHDRPGT